MKNFTLHNKEFFMSNKSTLSKKIKIGIITAFIIGLPTFMYISKTKNNENDPNFPPPPGLEEFEEAIPQQKIVTSIDDINNLNLVINNDNIDKEYISEIIDQLKSDGIECSLSNNNISNSDAVVISMEDNTNNPFGVGIIAPYTNEGNCNSDALALSLEASFYQKGFFTENITCGVFKSSDQSVGENTEYILSPSNIESIVENKNNVVFSTIRLNPEHANSNLVAEAIESSLSRYSSYLTNKSDTDLIKNENSKTVINSISNSYNEFDKNTNYSISNIKSHKSR